MSKPRTRSLKSAHPRRSVTLRLHSGVTSIRAGHPWVYRDGDTARLGSLPTGSIVRVVDARDGSFVAAGLYDATSMIAVRLLTRDPSEPVGRELLLRRCRFALERRSRFLAESATNCWRLVNAEGDGLGGLVVDLYDRWAVIKPYTPIWLDHLQEIAGELMRGLDLTGVMLQSFIRRRHDGAGLPDAGPLAAEPLAGREMPADLTVRENGLVFLAAVGDKRKTGIFLDARDNRREVAALCEGARVLNLFSYTAAYSVYAAHAGARTTVNVDLARSCAEWSRQNFRLNGIDPDGHEFVVADAYEYLAASPEHPFDLVILDPPSFATSKRHVVTARRGYQRLVEAACRFVRPGGILVCSSNTARTPTEDFVALVGKAVARSGLSYRLRAVRGLPADFLTLPSLPESRYLKCILGVLE